jgi:hypothetical protein
MLPRTTKENVVVNLKLLYDIILHIEPLCKIMKNPTVTSGLSHWALPGYNSSVTATPTSLCEDMDWTELAQDWLNDEALWWECQGFQFQKSSQFLVQFEILIVATELHETKSVEGECYVSEECSEEEKGDELRPEKLPLSQLPIGQPTHLPTVSGLGKVRACTWHQPRAKFVLWITINSSRVSCIRQYGYTFRGYMLIWLRSLTYILEEGTLWLRHIAA